MHIPKKGSSIKFWVSSGFLTFFKTSILSDMTHFAFHTPQFFDFRMIFRKLSKLFCLKLNRVTGLFFQILTFFNSNHELFFIANWFLCFYAFPLYFISHLDTEILTFFRKWLFFSSFNCNFCKKACKHWCTPYNVYLILIQQLILIWKSLLKKGFPFKY